MSEAIEKLRRDVEGLDERMIALFAERIRLAGALGVEKARRSVPIEDAEREAELRALHRSVAEREGVSPDLVQEVFTTILAISKRHQAERSSRGA